MATALTTGAHEANGRLSCLSGRQEEAYFGRYRRGRDPRLRERLVLQYEKLVRYVVRRFANRGEPVEDLVQVGMIGLINAIDRFEPGRGVRFSTFAMPTIVGELQRHFRDKAWAMKAPRRLKEVYQMATCAEEALARKLGRAPTVLELAASIDSSEEETLQALELRMVHNIASLDSCGSRGNEPTSCLGDTLGFEDEAIASMPSRADLEVALDALRPRDKAVLLLAIIEGMSQREIAARLDMSQMQVCRLIRRTLGTLKSSLSL